MKYNATTDFDKVVCVFPISGPYAILNRVLFYTILLGGVIAYSRKSFWVVLATWAYIMVYSATTVFHLFVMIITRRRGFYNLDIVGTWAIISAASLAAASIASFSTKLSTSRYRPLFITWGMTVAVPVYIFFWVYNNNYPLEPACRSSHPSLAGTLLIDPAQLMVPGHFDCTYQCFSKDYPTRSRAEITVVMAERLFSRTWKLWNGAMWLTFCLNIMGCMGTIMLMPRRRTRKELHRAVNASPPIDADAMSAHRASVRNAEQELKTGKPMPEPFLYSALAPLAIPIVIAFNEVYIGGNESLPVGEPAYAAGQWAPWVSVWLTLIAAAINTRYEPKWLKLKQEWEEHDRTIGSSSAVEQGTDVEKNASSTTTRTSSSSSGVGTSEVVEETGVMVGALTPPPKVHPDPTTRTAEVQRGR